MLSNLFTIEEVSEKLRIPKATLSLWRMNSSGPVYIRLGKNILYAEEDIEVFLDKHRRKSTSEALNTESTDDDLLC